MTIIEHLRVKFSEVDRDNSGKIDQDEFQAAITSFGFRPDPWKLESLFKKFDTDGSGDISVDEFLAFLDPNAERAPEEEEVMYKGKGKHHESPACDDLDEGIDAIDEDQERRWKMPQTPEEKRAALTSVVFTAKGMNSSELKQIFQKYDVDGSGTLEESELSQVLEDIILMVLDNDKHLAKKQKKYIKKSLRKLCSDAAKTTMKTMDDDGSGTIDIGEFKGYIKGGGFAEAIGKAIERDVQSISAAASMQNQKSRIKEMLFSKGGLVVDPQDLGIIFNKYDKDRSDGLDQQELEHVFSDLMKIVIKKDTTIDEDEKEYLEDDVPDFAAGAAASAFARIDEDNSGTLSVGEFKQFIINGDFEEILAFGS